MDRIYIKVEYSDKHNNFTKIKELVNQGYRIVKSTTIRYTVHFFLEKP